LCGTCQTKDVALLQASEDQVLQEGRLQSESICFTSSPVAASDSLDAPEAVIHGLSSDRLFFEPAGSTSSIVEETDEVGSALFQGSTAMVVDSVDPFMDFGESMEKMIRAHGVEDWEWLEEMLVWYLG
ncbi:unnamed protein product, partial [Musa acuminata var. zebrina]